jgi:hypothetical protein
VIEHALYASARSQARDGYQVVAASGGVCAEDQSELALWCPSHNGLLDESGTVQSINAHALPSGAHCVARSFAAQAEYSGRGGTHVVTHALILAAEDFARFANSPFAVMRAAVAAGQSTADVASERRLMPFSLSGRARPFDGAVVRHALAKHSLQDFARALETCLAADTAAIATSEDAATLIAALLNCLPTSLRAGISLATGLVHSSTRPYRWIGQAPDAHALRHLQNAYGVSVALLGGHRDDGCGRPGDCDVSIQHAWVGFVFNCLGEGHFTDLERQIHRLDGVQNVAELDAIAARELPTQPTRAGDADLAAMAGLSTRAHAPFESVR